MEVEWLILSDSAQVVSNKLYLLGGGWDSLAARKGFPFGQQCAIALAVKVPWNETNQRHKFEIEVFSEDQQTEEPRSMAKMGGQFEVGRPPGIAVGQDQRIQVVINLGLKIDSPGIKTVVARLGGVEAKRINFTVVATPTK